MADKDAITKEYMQDNKIFADAFNFYMYDGKQVIKPEQLRPLDTTAIALPFGNDFNAKPVQKYRDVLKFLTAMTDDNVAYVIYGIEVQSKMHFAMPVRNMLYDAISYSNQVEETAKIHRKNKDRPGSQDEFLSGFYEDDVLLPVITLVIYFGADEWTAPKSIYEMFGTKDPYILKFAQDYKINLIAPASIADEDFAKFSTELNQALKYVKYSSDKDKLRKLVNEDSAYQNISRKTADMINIVTGSELKFENGEESVDMCKAIYDIREDAKLEGKLEGRLEGKLEGKLEGTHDANVEVAKKLLVLKKFSVEEISSICSLALEEVEELSAEIMVG